MIMMYVVVFALKTHVLQNEHENDDTKRNMVEGRVVFACVKVMYYTAANLARSRL